MGEGLEAMCCSGVRNEPHILLEAVSADGGTCALEESKAAQGVAEDTDVFRCVEPALVPCPVRCRILFEMVLELLSVQEGGKELLKGDLTWSL